MSFAEILTQCLFFLGEIDVFRNYDFAGFISSIYYKCDVITKDGFSLI